MKATTTWFLFSKKIVSAGKRKQDVKSLAYEHMPHSSDYEQFRARLFSVNNSYTSEAPAWNELFAPVVDKTSVRTSQFVCSKFIVC